MSDSNWDEVLEKLTESFIHELHKITRRDIVKFCVENKTIRNTADEFLKKYTKSNQKNSALANAKKEEGNDKYSKKKYHESLLSYTESIFLANKHDECLPLAYSNRSLVLQHIGCLRECLLDINMAVDSGYPKSKSEKLVLRKAKCLLQLGEVENAREVLTQALKDCVREENSSAFKNELEKIKNLKNKENLNSKDSLPKLAGGENKDFVCASKYLSVNYDKTRGRHVVATEDIHAGDVLFVEKPYAYVLFEKDCQNCLKTTQAPIPCLSCTEVSYCSPKCRDEFWKIHYFECGFSELFKSVGIAYLSLRIVLNASSSLDELKKILEGISEQQYKNGMVVYKSKNYDSVYNLVHNFEKYEASDLFQYVMTALLLALYLKNQTNYFKAIPEEQDLELLTSIIFRHILQLVCNGHAITRVYCKRSQEKQIESKREVRCGTSIYPSASMMNHSCEPSVINSFHGKWLVVRAVKTIKRGEEVFNCYGPHARRMNRASRQELLSKQYFFQCKCQTCLQDVDIQDIFTAFKCTNCKGPSVSRAENLSCLDCGLTSKFSRELSRKCSKFYCLIQEGELLQKGDISLTLKKFLESWWLGREIFYKFHKDLAFAANEVARCLACLEDFRRCILFLRCCVRSVEERFGSLSIELADEMRNLGDVIMCYLVDCEDSKKRNLAQEGVFYYQKAQQIINLLYGSDFKESEEIETNKQKLKALINGK